MDDGRTTMVMNKFKEYQIYLIPNCAVYYRLEKDEYKDRAYLTFQYYNENDLVLYASTTTPRPNKRNNELVISSPKIVFFGSNFFDESCIYIALYSSKF